MSFKLPQVQFSDTYSIITQTPNYIRYFRNLCESEPDNYVTGTSDTLSVPFSFLGSDVPFWSKSFLLKTFLEHLG